MIAPLLSVCIITYNHGRFIRKCLEGILMQKTTFPYEVIIGEDCSTDNTRQIVAEFEAKYPAIVKPIYHAKNVGAACNNFKHCFSKIKSKYVAICDGDDYWTDVFKLQKQVEFLEHNLHCVLCFHRANTVNDADEVIQLQEPVNQIRHYTWKDIFHISMPTLSVVFRNCIKVIPKELLQAKNSDAFLFGMLSRYGGAADLGFNGAHYRIHAGGSYSGKSPMERYKQTIDTRHLMQRCSYFNRQQKAEIGKELNRRKILYIKYFLKKRELFNCLKILLT